jgi:guanylate kinase
VVAGPSGVGKSTLIERALEQNSNWIFSVSATTRSRREHEADGREYHFVERRKFLEMAACGKLLEYAEVYGNLYGTPAAEFERAGRAGKHLLIEVDTVGCLSIRAVRPDIPLLAILPPSIAMLRKRLAGRGSESEESLALRECNAFAELQRMRSFEFALVNDDLNRATEQLLNIMKVVEAGQMDVARSIDRIISTAGDLHEDQVQ